MDMVECAIEFYTSSIVKFHGFLFLRCFRNTAFVYVVIRRDYTHHTDEIGRGEFISVHTNKKSANEAARRHTNSQRREASDYAGPAEHGTEYDGLYLGGCDLHEDNDGVGRDRIVVSVQREVARSDGRNGDESSNDDDDDDEESADGSEDEEDDEDEDEALDWDGHKASASAQQHAPANPRGFPSVNKATQLTKKRKIEVITID
ncbi:hypothetical protein EJ08DRAFT_713508 [Tothia fuscella]|uniref:Uncharacterized protein n=1 Tax=Tothia fuscella TaxID=1048955 RepID=A0A9P4NST7_9PEZI|nr:hypothetical protein EJ08DRAFT_713508 [Tothia fuscella]